MHIKYSSFFALLCIFPLRAFPEFIRQVHDAAEWMSWISGTEDRRDRRDRYNLQLQAARVEVKLPGQDVGFCGFWDSSGIDGIAGDSFYESTPAR